MWRNKWRTNFCWWDWRKFKLQGIPCINYDKYSLDAYAWDWGIPCISLTLEGTLAFQIKISLRQSKTMIIIRKSTKNWPRREQAWRKWSPKPLVLFTKDEDKQTKIKKSKREKKSSIFLFDRLYWKLEFQERTLETRRIWEIGISQAFRIRKRFGQRMLQILFTYQRSSQNWIVEPSPNVKQVNWEKSVKPWEWLSRQISEPSNLDIGIPSISIYPMKVFNNTWSGRVMILGNLWSHLPKRAPFLRETLPNPNLHSIEHFQT